MPIRKALDTDREAILELYSELYDTLTGFGLPFSLSSDELGGILAVMLRSKLCLICVAEEDGRVQGFLSAGITRMDRKLRFEGQVTIGRVSDVYVAPALRGRGIARDLLAFAEDWFRLNGVGIVESHVLLENRASAAFFQKNGYSELSRVLYKALRPL